MYQPHKYKNNQPEYIFNFIQQHPFAILVMHGRELLATHVPVLVDGNAANYRLFAHIANHNPMREYLADTKEMLLIFTGPDAYISSSWYSEPDIPTWDYAAVHINAEVRLQTEDELQVSLEKLIAHFEKDQPSPLAIGSIPENTWRENFQEITGFWLLPNRAVGIEKLHQGFSKHDVKTITNKLDAASTCPVHPLSKLLSKKHEL